MSSLDRFFKEGDICDDHRFNLRKCLVFQHHIRSHGLIAYNIDEVNKLGISPEFAKQFQKPFMTRNFSNLLG